MKTKTKVKTDLKITIDQLKNYLGTALKFELQIDCHEDYGDLDHCSEFQKAFSKGALWEFVAWSDIGIPLGESEFEGELLQYEKGICIGNYGHSKPICYRLSDLDKFIPELGFVPIEQLTPYAKNRLKYVIGNKEDLSDWTFQDMEKLFHWHFWPFGDKYFEQGLVIDKLAEI